VNSPDSGELPPGLAAIRDANPNWRCIAGALLNPEYVPAACTAMQDEPSYLYVLLIAHGPLSECRGDYGGAEAAYERIVNSDSEFGQCLESILAQQRLRRIAPLAAIEAIIEAESGATQAD